MAAINTSSVTVTFGGPNGVSFPVSSFDINFAGSVKPELGNEFYLDWPPASTPCELFVLPLVPRSDQDWGPPTCHVCGFEEDEHPAAHLRLLEEMRQRLKEME